MPRTIQCHIAFIVICDAFTLFTSKNIQMALSIIKGFLINYNHRNIYYHILKISGNLTEPHNKILH